MTADDESKELINELRNAWIFGKHISTLPRWTSVQRNALADTGSHLPDIDADTRSTIIRQFMFTLRCHQCERRLTDQCNFSICVRGLMAGVSGMR